jgi:predicted nucleic acid-binding protein
MAKYLLDTTILIEHLRGRKEAVDLLTVLARQGHRLGLCCINVAELYSGLSHEERARADRLIDSLDFYDVTREVAKQAGQYRYDFARRGVTLSTADTLVAATAVAESATLVTANTKDFPMKEIDLLEHP